MTCIECEHWVQLANNGEDVCMATKDENCECLVIPPTEEVPEWCPLKRTL